MRGFRANYFTLIEILISLGLTSLILTTLSYFFYQVNVLNVRSDAAEQETFRLLYLENRLAGILPKIVSGTDPQKDFYLFTGSSTDSIFLPGSPYLVFTYDNSVNLVDPHFSNHVLGRLFVDNTQALTLAIFPSPNRWEAGKPIPIKREVLLNNVEKMALSFFVPPKKERGFNGGRRKLPPDLSPVEIEASGEWIDEWKYAYYHLPALIKLELTVKGQAGIQKKTMVFPLSNSSEYILYGR